MYAIVFFILLQPLPKSSHRSFTLVKPLSYKLDILFVLKSKYIVERKIERVAASEFLFHFVKNACKTIRRRYNYD